MAKSHLKEIRAEVRGMDDQRLAAEFKEARASLFTLRSQAVTEKVENNAQFSRQRRQIARLLTERRSRQIAKAGGNGKARAAATAERAAPLKKTTTRKSASTKKAGAAR